MTLKTVVKFHQVEEKNLGIRVPKGFEDSAHSSRARWVMNFEMLLKICLNMVNFHTERYDGNGLQAWSATYVMLEIRERWQTCYWSLKESRKKSLVWLKGAPLNHYGSMGNGVPL